MGLSITLLFLATTVVFADDNDNNNRLKIGFGSCHKNKRAGKPPIWDSIQKEALDVWVWTGDAVYTSGRDAETGKKHYRPAEPSELQLEFDQLKENATIGYKEFLTHKEDLQIYGVWDDHDFGGNDIGIHMPDKRERQQLFWNFLGYKPHTHDGVYHSVDLQNGKVKLIMLDTRWFRDDHCIPSFASYIPFGNLIACVTRWLTAGLYLHKFAWMWNMDKCEQGEVLGQDQWDWLEATLAVARANPETEAVLIVSSIQVLTTGPSMESWGQFPKEQERLWNLLQHHYSSPLTANPPIFFLSGDVHHAEMSGQKGYMEITSSGMTHHCAQPKLYGHMCKPLLQTFHKHRHSYDDYFIGLNYGMIDFDWTSRLMTTHIKDNTGRIVLSYSQSLDDRVTGLGPYADLPHTWDGHLIPLLLLVLTLAAFGIRAWRRIQQDSHPSKFKGE
ncbi:unnamed protein product [Cylindrotheca closterium]|uniref:PhoD-like phosphatase metallophosphatase domain-containing protein n=1 Tax=Cylindrotheca closterium TaxID=2856 RepID=A0AAD2FZ50_9STRA|nr:unnamed protein product [Cylindrotheca closterium]